MKLDKPLFLVLGATGFIGSHITREFLRAGKNMRGFSRSWDSSQWYQYLGSGEIDIHEGSVLDKGSLRDALQGVDVVLDFTSFSFPSTSPKSLQTELNATLQAMETILSAMVDTGVRNIVYPSSGGTIYGDTSHRPALESDPVKPLSSYGVGKLLCEEMIRFYSRVHGIKYQILRISNAYGSSHLRRISQGVIDVFLERVLMKEPILVWGSTEIIRDYLFIDDLVEAVNSLINLGFEQSLVVNVGSGEAVSLIDIIQVIKQVTGYKVEWIVDPNRFYGLIYNALDISLLYKLTQWQPKYSIEKGITEAWIRKKYR
jgi:UDP-glucose 4-epimerase